MIVDASGRPVNVIPSPATRADQARQGRADRWVNPATGIGTLEDKTRAGFYAGVWRIPDTELTDIVNGSDIGAKIVEKRVDEMFRRGYELGAGKKDPVDGSAIEEFREYLDTVLFLDKRLKKGAKWGRQYGGALGLLGVDDGSKDQTLPLNEDAIRDFSFINIVDRRYCWVGSYYSDPGAPKFGEPMTYWVSNGVAAANYRPMSKSAVKKRDWALFEVHETRVLRFGGVETDRQTQTTLAGWEFSVLQRVYEQLRQFDHSFDSSEYLLADASQGIFKLKGLLNALSAGKEQQFADRVELLERTRSVMHGVALDVDGGEDFTRVATPLTGVPDLLDRFMQRVAAAGDYPVQELFGAGAGGLNAAGEAESATRKWYDTIASDRTRDVDPMFLRVLRLVMKAGKSPLGKKDVKWNLKWHPLWSATDKEIADTKLAKAQKDTIYLNDGVVSEEVVALTVAEDYPALDTEAIEEALEAKETFDPHENDPEPELPPAVDAAGNPVAAPPPKPGAAPGKAAAPPGRQGVAKAKPKPPPAKK